MGNSKATTVNEANIEEEFWRPQTVSSLKSFIKQKFVTRKHLLSDWVPALPHNVPV